MTSRPRRSTARLDAIARQVAQHGPDGTRSIADTLVAAALDRQIDGASASRLAAMRPKVLPDHVDPAQRRRR